MEWKFFEGDSPEFASADWYESIISAHHLDEPAHRERLIVAAEYAKKAVKLGGTAVVDLGCGDGGLLQLLKESNFPSWGYDLMPNNIEHAVNVRGVDARFTNFISDDIEYADVAVMTETLEHMEDPHQVVRDLPSKYLIASSPYNESDKSHYEFHLWAWDSDGYDELIRQGGYTILEKDFVSGWSQILLGVRK